MTDLPDAVVELTSEERAAIRKQVTRLAISKWRYVKKDLFRAVESIVAARVAAIREALAQEIEARRVPYTLQETAGRCWALGQQEAARIVRGYLSGTERTPQYHPRTNGGDCQRGRLSVLR